VANETSHKVIPANPQAPMSPGRLRDAEVLERSTGVPPVTHGQDARAPFLNPFEEIDRHWHNLPHWQQSETWQFVTWRLGDSLPGVKLQEWEDEKKVWRERHLEPWDLATEQEYHLRFSTQVDEWLDAGHGSCVLRDTRCANIVANALHHFAGERYELGAFAVMPNHVHVLFRPTEGNDIRDILHSWKSFTAKVINKALGNQGALWQGDYWDRMIRHEDHWIACLDYIEDNPVMAHLREGEFIVYRSTGILPVKDHQ
jgi:REP element-mobilizing transposase RayT